MDKSDWMGTGPREGFERRSCCRSDGKEIGLVTPALRLKIVSEVEKTAAFGWLGARLTARASSATLRILEKGGLKFLHS
jgi:hypothetical protein